MSDPKPRECDEESKAMWKELRGMVEGNRFKFTTCCQILEEVRLRHGDAKKGLIITWGPLQMPLKYCPSCGRKLS